MAAWARAILFLLFLGALGVCVWLAMPQRVVVDVVSISRGDLIEQIELDGTAQATHRIVMAAPINGMLREVALRSGESIEAEQVLLVIDPLPSPLLDERSRGMAEAKRGATHAEWQRAQISIKIAENSLSQVQKKKAALVVPNSQSRPLTPDLDNEEKLRKQELDLAKLSEERARFEYEGVLAQLGNERESSKSASETTGTDKSTANSADTSSVQEKDKAEKRRSDQDKIDVRAPSSGHVLRVLRSDAGIVSAGTPILELGNLDALEYSFDVATTDAMRLTIGGKVRIKIGVTDASWMDGTIQEIERSASPHISPLGVEESKARVVAVSSTPEGNATLLGHGYQVRGQLIVREHRNVLKVPVGALFRENGSWYLYRCKNGKAIKQSVELGPRNEVESSIISSLEEFTPVILFPSDRIQDGTPIAIR